MGWDATPQQAVVRKSEFKAAVKPPMTQAVAENLSSRNRNQAQKPTKKSANGAYNFENKTGPAIMFNVEVNEGHMTPLFPNQFKSAQTPVKDCGGRLQAAFCCPRGPSFEKTNQPGNQHRKKSSVRATRIRPSKSQPSFRDSNDAGFGDKFMAGDGIRQLWCYAYKMVGSKA